MLSITTGNDGGAMEKARPVGDTPIIIVIV